MRLPLFLYLLASIAPLSAAVPLVLQQPNERDGVTVELSPPDQTVKAGDALRLRYLYSFKKMGRYMNPFALTHNHFHPTGEIRIFKEDGTFYAVLVAHAFAGNFPDAEYLMYEESLLGFSTSLPTATESAVTPTQIVPGRYRLQLAVYDKFWLGSWAQKEREPKAVLFSNIVTCTIEIKYKSLTSQST